MCCGPVFIRLSVCLSQVTSSTKWLNVRRITQITLYDSLLTLFSVVIGLIYLSKINQHDKGRATPLTCHIVNRDMHIKVIHKVRSTVT